MTEKKTRERRGIRPVYRTVKPPATLPEPHHDTILFAPEPQSYPDSTPVITGVPGFQAAFTEESGATTRSYYDETPVIREPDSRRSLRKELLRPRDLDNGSHRGLIFKEPANRRNIEGFIRIPTVWGSQLRPTDALKRSVIGLAEAINRYTGVRADIDPHLMLDSSRLQKTPFVYITIDQAFELTAVERKNFSDYLRNGGFAVLDNGAPEYKMGVNFVIFALGQKGGIAARAGERFIDM